VADFDGGEEWQLGLPNLRQRSALSPRVVLCSIPIHRRYRGNAVKTSSLMLIAAISAIPILASAQDQAGSGKAYADAMQKMMQAMRVQPAGNPDEDFVLLMMAHHQGAIDMANVELKYGKDPELRRMAGNIVSSQEKEIAEMKHWLTKQNQ
jgi:DUF305 family protein family protein